MENRGSSVDQASETGIQNRLSKFLIYFQLLCKIMEFPALGRGFMSLMVLHLKSWLHRRLCDWKSDAINTFAYMCVAQMGCFIYLALGLYSNPLWITVASTLCAPPQFFISHHV
jgi:hypothetical protein